MIRLTYGLKAILLLSFLLCFVGCSALDLDQRKPEKVDFSGHWVLNLPLSEGVIENPRSRNDVFDSDQIKTEGMATGDLLDPFVFVLHDFHVINAQSLTIELDPISAGLDYQPGTYRDVTFGEHRRGLWDIYAGWDGDDLVILSRANKLQVMERISLVSPNRLRIIVGIEAEKKNRDFVKVFDRKRVKNYSTNQ